jgi:hypothetical protein
LLLDVTKGRVANFSRSDAMHAAWRILGPLLPLAPQTTYPHGSEFGPEASDQVITKEVGANSPWVGTAADTQSVSPALDGWSATADQSVLAGTRLELDVSLSRMRQLSRAILFEMREGLQSRPSSMKMIPSFVTRLPNGDETGVYYALDLGGTNFRVSRFMLAPSSPVMRTDEVHFKIPGDVMQSSSETNLFDFMAECVVKVQKDKRKSEAASYGFTFSFPVQQTSLASGALTCVWSLTRRPSTARHAHCVDQGFFDSIGGGQKRGGAAADGPGRVRAAGQSRGAHQRHGGHAGCRREGGLQHQDGRHPGHGHQRRVRGARDQHQPPSARA